MMKYRFLPAGSSASLRAEKLSMESLSIPPTTNENTHNSFLGLKYTVFFGFVEELI